MSLGTKNVGFKSQKYSNTSAWGREMDTINCKLNNKCNNDFLYPVVFNSIIAHNPIISKFSPQAGATCSPAIYMFNNNDVFVQVRKGDCVARLISLDIRGGGQPNK